MTQRAPAPRAPARRCRQPNVQYVEMLRPFKHMHPEGVVASRLRPNRSAASALSFCKWCARTGASRRQAGGAFLASLLGSGRPGEADVEQQVGVGPGCPHHQFDHLLERSRRMVGRVAQAPLRCKVSQVSSGKLSSPCRNNKARAPPRFNTPRHSSSGEQVPQGGGVGLTVAGRWGPSATFIKHQRAVRDARGLWDLLDKTLSVGIPISHHLQRRMRIPLGVFAWRVLLEYLHSSQHVWMSPAINAGRCTSSSSRIKANELARRSRLTAHRSRKQVDGCIANAGRRPRGDKGDQEATERRAPTPSFLPVESPRGGPGCLRPRRACGGSCCRPEPA